MPDSSCNLSKSNPVLISNLTEVQQLLMKLHHSRITSLLLDYSPNRNDIIVHLLYIFIFLVLKDLLRQFIFKREFQLLLRYLGLAPS